MIVTGPLPFLNTDGFESNHGPFKRLRQRKRTSVNLLKTLMDHHERISVYNSTSGMFQTAIETKIKSVCKDDIAMEYLRKTKVAGGTLFCCNKLAVYGTDYRVNQYVLLEESTNNNPVFGRIKQLICCQKFGYLILQIMHSKYCERSDLHFVTDSTKNILIQVEHLADFHPLEGNALFSV